MRWWLDRRLWKILGSGLVLRVLPLAIWSMERCARDECTYIAIADRIARGEGMTSSVGWLWAPGYPYLLALHKWALGYSAPAALTQLPIALGTVLMIVALTRRVLAGAAERRVRDASHLAAALCALSPTQIFFSINLWSEACYTALLLGTLLLLLRARDRQDGAVGRALGAAALCGLTAGLTALFRGIGVYLLPVYALGLLWGRPRRPLAWGQLAVLALVAILTVAPYSRYASEKFGGRVVSDLTLGQMMWLGDNDFLPVSFDYGNGLLSAARFERLTAEGREHCAPVDQVVARDRCETAAGFAWIGEHPIEFVRRIPYRLAQLLTPHSMLTRHLRWGRWRGMPFALAEGVVAWNAAWNLLVLWAGLTGMALWARATSGLVSAATVAAHVLPIALLAGLSRYRVPIEPLLMVYAGVMLTDPRRTLTILRCSPPRALLAGALLGALIPLSLYFLPAGWPGWRSW